MRASRIVVSAAMLAFFASTTQAASEDDLVQIREQLQALMQRVDRLERENIDLKAQNAQFAAPVKQDAAVKQEAGSAKRPDNRAEWVDRVQVKGDVRYRVQQSDDERVAAQRDEHVLRARLNVEAKVTDSMTATIGIATSQGGNPRGANVQLDGEFSRKPLYLDLGYFDWTIARGLHAIGGKMKMPYVRPGQSLFRDNDINPEGIAFTYANGSLFGSAYGFWVEENVQYAAVASAANDTTDAKLFGMQVGNRFKLGAGELVVAASYADLVAGEGRRPFFSGSNGNTVRDVSGVLAFDFDVVEGLVEFNTQVGKLPLQLWLDYAHNGESELNKAMAAGAMLGKAANPGSWEAGLAYQLIEKDALFAQQIDSDFAGGVSDSAGWILRTGYAPLKNWSVNATYLVAKANVDVGTQYDFKRLLLDFNAKF